MVNLDYKNLYIIEKYKYPFPIIIYSGLLTETQLDLLQNSISDKATIFDKKYMGNRKTILKGTKNFNSFLKKNQITNLINKFFEDKKLFNFFYNNLNQINQNEKKKFELKNKKFKFLSNYINRDSKFKFKLKNKINKISSLYKNDHRIYCDFDFSVAGPGYAREPHRDRDERVLVFLYYINNFNNDKGGNLQIFEYKNAPNEYLQKPDVNDLTISHNLHTKRGNLITFMSTPDSIHGVDEIMKSEDKRYFFYGSYSSINKVEWEIC